MYQKTNAMSEIRKINKDNFWAQAEVRPYEFCCCTDVANSAHESQPKLKIKASVANRLFFQKEEEKRRLEERSKAQEERQQLERERKDREAKEAALRERRDKERAAEIDQHK